MFLELKLKLLEGILNFVRVIVKHVLGPAVEDCPARSHS
jgi:hypothetical protein